LPGPAGVAQHTARRGRQGQSPAHLFRGGVRRGGVHVNQFVGRTAGQRARVLLRQRQDVAFLVVAGADDGQRRDRQLNGGVGGGGVAHGPTCGGVRLNGQ